MSFENLKKKVIKLWDETPTSTKVVIGVAVPLALTATYLIYQNRFIISHKLKSIMGNNVLELLLKRVARKDGYTIGNLYINGIFFCNTLEDTDRGLKSTMTAAEIGKLKIAKKTAIPTGKYRVDMNTISPKYSQAKTANYAPYGYRVPRLQNVVGYDGVLIHIGNSADDTDGCILIGKNNQVGRLTNSKATFDEFMKIALSAHNSGKPIYITIQ